LAALSCVREERMYDLGRFIRTLLHELSRRSLGD
jgi:hypothetical protein